MARRYRILPHTSEVAVEASGKSWPAFYESAAEGLVALYEPAPAPKPVERRRLEMKADSAEELLVGWLNELNFLIGAKRWIPAKVRVKEAIPTRLVAELSGSPLAEGGRLAREIKAATFGGLHVEARRGGGWKAVVILDV